jgi:hypothetical protein
MSKKAKFLAAFSRKELRRTLPSEVNKAHNPEVQRTIREAADDCGPDFDAHVNEVLTFVVQHPGATSRQISDGTALDWDGVKSLVLQLCDAGQLVRGRTPSKRYGYWRAQAEPKSHRALLADASTTLSVSGLPRGVREDEVRATFERHGTVERVRIPEKGSVAFVTFRRHVDARGAHAARNGISIRGRRVLVRWAQP